MQIKTIATIILFVFTGIFGQSLFRQSSSRQAALLKTASALEARGQYDLAASKYMQLSEINPANLGAYLGVKRSLFETAQFDRFEKFVRSLQKVRRDIRYEIDLAEVQYLRGDKKGALEHWDTIVTENAKNRQTYSLIGRALQQYQLYEKAALVYKRARETFKDNKLFVFELAGIYQRLGDFDSMVYEYIRYLNYNKNQISFINSRLAAVENNNETKDKIGKALNKAAKEKIADLNLLRQLLGSHYLRNKKYEEAYQSYLLIETDLGDQAYGKSLGIILYNFATVLLKEAQFELAQKAFGLVLQKYPDTDLARKSEFGLAELYEKQEQYDQAVLSFKRLFDKYPKTSEGLQALLRTGDIQYNVLFDLESASNTFKSIIDNFNNARLQLQAMEKRANCLIALNSLDEAEQTLKRITSLVGGLKVTEGRKASFDIAQLKFYRGDFDESISILEKLVSQESSKSPDLVENDALEMLFLLKSHRGDSLSLARLGRARLQYRQRQYNPSINTITEAISKNPQTELAEEFAFLKADNKERLGSYQEAVSALLDVYNNETSLNRDLALLRIGTIYAEKLSDKKNAEQYYEKLLMEFPNSIYVEECRAKMRQIL